MKFHVPLHFDYVVYIKLVLQVGQQPLSVVESHGGSAAPVACSSFLWPTALMAGGIAAGDRDLDGERLSVALAHHRGDQPREHAPLTLFPARAPRFPCAPAARLDW